VTASRITSGLPPGRQIPQPRVETDGREEVDEQHVAGGEIELDRHAQGQVEQGKEDREQQAAGHRLGNVGGPEDLRLLNEPAADEERQDAVGHGAEGTDEKGAFDLLHGSPQRNDARSRPESHREGSSRRQRRRRSVPVGLAAV
jgi:hypothetical protein